MQEIGCVCVLEARISDRSYQGSGGRYPSHEGLKECEEQFKPKVVFRRYGTKSLTRMAQERTEEKRKHADQFFQEVLL